MNRRRFAIALLVPLLLYPAARSRDIMRFTHEGLELFNVKRSVDARGAAVYSMEDITYAANDVPHITDLALSFNRDAGALVRDDTGHYQVRLASFGHETAGGVMGGGGARFFKADDRVELETKENLWLTECADLGSFTIEFRMKPRSLNGTHVVFSRTGFLSGAKNGIEILLVNRRVSVRLHGMFKNIQGHRVDVHLNRGAALRENRWHHFMLSYDRLSGRIARYTDGAEDEVLYMTGTREPYVNVYEPAFYCKDRPVAVIGKDFYGIIDEFRITHREYRDLKKETVIAYSRYRKLGEIGRKPVNREGVVTSPVYTLPLTGTMVTGFTWDETLRRDTFVWMEFRISDYLFSRNDETPRWYRISRGQRNIFQKKTPEGDYLRGRFCQWRAHLVPSPDGKHSPLLGGIEMTYQNDLPPRAPSGFEVVSAGSEKVRLRWKKNLESDVLGYRVYYGVQPGKYDGMITFAGGKRIPSEGQLRNGAIEVELDNTIIGENRKLDGKSVLRYPVLKNTVLYYFTVSAYDNYKPGTEFNHESEPSAEVTARPFAGSEID
jgi:hypothetical protein